MSATLTRILGIPFSMAEPVTQPTLTATGHVDTVVYHGEVKVRFAVDPSYTFRLFCLFSEHHPPAVPMLLGLHDTLEVFRFHIDGAAAPGAPVGHVRLETYT